VGFVKLTKQGDKVIVRGETTGLTAGFHGFHVHAVGQCVAPFTSAGGHYNPGGASHGSLPGSGTKLTRGILTRWARRSRGSRVVL